MRSFLVLLAFLLAAPVAADPVTVGGCVITSQGPVCVMPDTAPRALSATYDPATHTLSLAWQAPEDGTPDSYTVYRDDTALGTTTSLSYDDDITNLDGLHYYYVTATKTGVESPQSDLLWLAKGGGAIPTIPCDPLVLGVYTGPPWVAYAIHDECLPP